MKNLAQRLEKALGQKLDRDDKSTFWRVGRLYSYAEWSNGWAETGCVFNIRPNESLREIEEDESSTDIVAIF